MTTTEPKQNPTAATPSAPVKFITNLLSALVRDGGAMERRIEIHKGRF